MGGKVGNEIMSGLHKIITQFSRQADPGTESLAGWMESQSDTKSFLQ